MELSDYSKHYYEKMFPGHQTHLCTTDPELIERFQNFAFDEVVNSDDLDGRTRFMAILSALLGCQGTDLFRDMLPAALNLSLIHIYLWLKLLLVLARAMQWFNPLVHLMARFAYEDIELACDDAVAKEMCIRDSSFTARCVREEESLSAKVRSI